MERAGGGACSLCLPGQCGEGGMLSGKVDFHCRCLIVVLYPVNSWCLPGRYLNGIEYLPLASMECLVMRDDSGCVRGFIHCSYNGRKGIGLVVVLYCVNKLSHHLLEYSNPGLKLGHSVCCGIGW